MTLHDDVMRLDSRLAAARPYLAKCDGYYEGEQPLKYMAPALQDELGERITQLVINLPRLAADAYEARLDVEGFRFSTPPNPGQAEDVDLEDDAAGDDRLWGVWQANDMDEQAQQAHLESLVLSRSYVTVGSPDAAGDPPLISIESPFQMVTARDPRTRRVTSALKRWVEDDARTQSGVLYTPGATTLLTYDRGKWRARSTDRHELGRVPVVPLVNRPRLLRPDGVAEFHDVIPYADAANKMATDMMISGEFHAMPRRWAFGLSAEDFVDESGNPINAWSRDAGTLWANKSTEVKVGQFDESDLAVFHQTIKVLLQIAGMQLALPPGYLSFETTNPPSADAIRSSESRLVKNVERKQTFLGGGWEEVMRIALRFMDGRWDERAWSLETMWRDPATPTVAQKADAVQKLVGRPVMPVEMGREELGWSPQKRKRARAMDEREALDPLAERLLRPVTAQAVPDDAAGG